MCTSLNTATKHAVLICSIVLYFHALRDLNVGKTTVRVLIIMLNIYSGLILMVVSEAYQIAKIFQVALELLWWN